MTIVSQKVAVITGASQGIGAALVQAYRKNGWAVLANSRSIPGCIRRRDRHRGRRHRRSSHGPNVIDTAVREFGPIDTLVNNAGVFVARPFTDYTAEEYEFLVGVNLTGFVRTTQLATAQMLRQGEGAHVVRWCH